MIQKRFSKERKPSDKQELLLLIGIINNMLNNLYILDKKFNDTFFYRFESDDAFFSLLNEGIERYSVGSSYVLYGLLPEEYKYRKEDVIRYEAKVIERINNGTYLKLSLDGTPVEGQRQKFNITGM